jgi:Tfp pilus assembly protein PilF
MNIDPSAAIRRGYAAGLLTAILAFTSLDAAAQNRATNAVVIEAENMVEVLRVRSAVWDRAYAGTPLYGGDQLRTGARSRAVVRHANRTNKRLDSHSMLRIDPDDGGVLHFLRGAMYYFHRDNPGTRMRIPNGFAVIRGTEFHLHVAEDDTTTLSLFDGEVDLQTAQGNLKIYSGERAIAAPGVPPRKERMASATAMLAATNLIQWVLYYPGVIEVDELLLDGQTALSGSLQAYRAGDIRGALVAWPEGRVPATGAEKVFRAGLLLSVGDVPAARELLSAVTGAANASDSREARLGMALQHVIAAVQNPSPAGHSNAWQPGTNALATEWLSESYVRQAQLNLPAALVAAKRAAEIAPRFGFAWARVAELEFSFRRLPAARRALERSLELAPRNAQSRALSGFVAAAENDIDLATHAFNDAIALDGALGNAWLGRGLCRIRQGDAAGGREDLQTAAVLEPQRAVLRSYLAKAWSNEGDGEQAAKEIRLARELDPNDPTAWLYSALLNEQQNRINDAVRDLERSQERSNNRQIYRSQLLLDEDSAVRRANLAGIYRDAGMTEVSVREAARAASVDYANYSAHLFLAHSYDAMRDPRQIDLRFETAFLSEFLLANLLSPAAVGTLTPQVSQQEYARLFERDRVGLASSTEYFDNGDWVQSAVQYGSYKDFSYSVEAAYRNENGDRPNDELEQTALTLKLKQQFTPRDGVYFQASFYDAESGDVGPRYDPNGAIIGLRVKEEQVPLLIGGYHHEWSPGQHTLVLLGRAPDQVRVRNPQQGTLGLDRNNDGSIADVFGIFLDERYESRLELYTAELQQIMSHPGGTFIGGGRLQGGGIDTATLQNDERYLVPDPSLFPPINWPEVAHSEFGRASIYGYELWQVHSSLQLIGGVSYDWLRYPRNFRFAPVADDESTTDRVSPKAGFIYTPLTNTVVRGAYTRGLGGVSFDQSFRLEPSQVAGFNQAFRSIIPESIAGANAAASFESSGLSLEQKFRTGTYLGLSGEMLASDVTRDIGAFDVTVFGPSSAQIREKLHYRERSLLAAFNQLVGEGLSLGAVYRLSRAELKDQFPGIPAAAGFSPSQNLEATLHHFRLFAIYNHSSGWFAQFESAWFAQMNDGYSAVVRDDSFWQHNAYVGYRFARRRAEVRVGILNLTDEDYRLNPLNLTARLPRERTFYSSLQLNF